MVFSDSPSPGLSFWSDATDPDYGWYDLEPFGFGDMMVHADGIANHAPVSDAFGDSPDGAEAASMDRTVQAESFAGATSRPDQRWLSAK